MEIIQRNLDASFWFQVPKWRQQLLQLLLCLSVKFVKIWLQTFTWTLVFQCVSANAQNNAYKESVYVNQTKKKKLHLFFNSMKTLHTMFIWNSLQLCAATTSAHLVCLACSKTNFELTNCPLANIRVRCHWYDGWGCIWNSKRVLSIIWLSLYKTTVAPWDWKSTQFVELCIPFCTLALCKLFCFPLSFTELCPHQA